MRVVVAGVVLSGAIYIAGRRRRIAVKAAPLLRNISTRLYVEYIKLLLPSINNSYFLRKSRSR